jgi:hypothetical protein
MSTYFRSETVMKIHGRCNVPLGALESALRKAVVETTTLRQLAE